MPSIEFIALKAASGAYCEDLPDNWEGMTDEERDDHLVSTAQDRFDGQDADEIFSYIDNRADFIKNAIIDVLDIVKKEIVKAAINDELDTDMNLLDLHAMVGLRSLNNY